MPIFPIESFDDPRLAPYRDMKEKDLARHGRRFIAEGQHLVRRLLDSRLTTESVLLSSRQARDFAASVPPDISVFLAPEALVNSIVGFKFHSGILAVGIRPASLPLSQIIAAEKERMTLAILQEIANTENMGSLIRIAASFGVDALILGERCCDPFFRQSVRVSMGSVFKVPIVQSINLMEDLKNLRENWRFDLAAAVLSDKAENLSDATRAARLGIVFGNEAQGLDAETIAACNRQVTIPMKLGTDSLNVAVAAGIFLYHFTQ